MSTKETDSTYVHIGQRIRERRKILNLSQTQLGELMGFSCQQMQRYESGENQISAGKLLQLAKILNVPVGHFYAEINLNETLGTRIQSDTIQRDRTKPLSILLVEDNPADVILFNRVVSSCSDPVDVHVIHSPEKVMNFLCHHDTKYGKNFPDIAVIDLSMPKLSGIELLRKIKNNSKTEKLPVVILTNSISMKDLQTSYREGAAGFIQKSVDLAEYMHSMKTAIEYWSKILILPCSQEAQN